MKRNEDMSLELFSFQRNSLFIKNILDVGICPHIKKKFMWQYREFHISNLFSLQRNVTRACHVEFILYFQRNSCKITKVCRYRFFLCFLSEKQLVLLPWQVKTRGRGVVLILPIDKPQMHRMASWLIIKVPSFSNNQNSFCIK